MRFEDHQYYVYILASRSRTLYIGVTNNLLHRIAQHRTGKAPSFTSRYKTHRLVYFERFQYINNAIAREKYLKHFTREEKSHSSNPLTQPGKTSPPNHSRFQHPPRRALSFPNAESLPVPCFRLCFLVVILPRSRRICF
jgi:predicted GIY-YIG superfamily endonuclease